MAEIAVTTAGRVNVVGIPTRFRTLNANEAILAGDAVRIVPTGGIGTAAQFTKANASGTAGTPPSGEAALYGIATHSVNAGQALTAIREGKMSGWTFSQNYGAPVYLSNTDGRLSDGTATTPTVSVIIGYIVPTTANPRNDAEDKILEINISN
jgi:hypothetical protein